MVKVTRKRASLGQEINPLDPRFVTETDLWAASVTVKVCLATVSKGWLPEGPPEAHFHRTAYGGQGMISAFDILHSRKAYLLLESFCRAFFKKKRPTESTAE